VTRFSSVVVLEGGNAVLLPGVAEGNADLRTCRLLQWASSNTAYVLETQAMCMNMLYSATRPPGFRSQGLNVTFTVNHVHE
jgi:hypothetical protein